MSPRALEVDEAPVLTADGWQLRLRRTLCPERFDASRKPLLIVPGYGMNSFIFSYHPRGTSMERCLAEAGFEVWAIDLRGQGGARPPCDPAPAISFDGYVAEDLPAAVAGVLAKSKTGADAVVLLGASLGGSIAFGYLALAAEPRVAALIAIGAPLRWVQVHPLVRVLFASTWVAGALKLRDTRTWMRRLAPLLHHVPWLLGMYANLATIDMASLTEMTETVEDPQPEVNRDIARWLRARDLVLRGKNVTEQMRRIRVPLLLVLSNRDGIVPESTALSAADYWGSSDVEVLRVGDERDWYAHANLFVGNEAPARVFDPMIRWLRRVA